MDALREENERLRQRIAELEAALDTDHTSQSTPAECFNLTQELNNDEIRRFGRQLILPQWGKQAQLALRNTAMLVVGAGGLGSPACLYLGAGGVGRIGIVDHDTVDVSNLHRQIIHTEKRQGMNKALSAMTAIQAINASCQVTPYTCTLDRTNALDIIRQYDIIVDATDNIATRYLLNDASVIAGKPLVSGSALRYDGQLTVYNYCGGPCFRCLHPVPPPPASVGRCADSGVLGVVPGIIGILQALEAMKVAVGQQHAEPTFLIFSAMASPLFRTVKLRGRKKNCAVCGDHPTVTELVDYVQFCGSGPSDHITPESVLGPHERIQVQEYQSLIAEQHPHLLIDVRPSIQYEICSLAQSKNIPLDELDRRIPEIKQAMSENRVSSKDGNDSQLAVRELEKHGIKGTRDIAGGLLQWATEIDTTFPVY